MHNNVIYDILTKYSPIVKGKHKWDICDAVWHDSEEQYKLFKATIN